MNQHNSQGVKTPAEHFPAGTSMSMTSLIFSLGMSLTLQGVEKDLFVLSKIETLDCVCICTRMLAPFAS